MLLPGEGFCDGCWGGCCDDCCDFGAGWSGVPANAGVFESSYDVLSTGVEVNF